MALTSAQEQYLKGLGIGKGAGTAGALSGAGKGASIGTMIMPGVGTAVGGILGGIAGLFGGKSKAKKEQAAARAQLEQANATFNRGEDTRLARLGAGQALLAGLSGRGFTNVDPATLEKLQTRRELDPAEAGLYNPEAGAVSGAIGDLGNSAMDIASQYGINKGSSAPATASGPSVIPTQEIVPFDPKIGRGVSFGSGTQDFG